MSKKFEGSVAPRERINISYVPKTDGQSVEINQDGVAALITTLDRRISDLLDEIIHFCEFQQSASHWQRVLH